MADVRLAIFKELRRLLGKYEPPMTAVSDFEGRYELVSKKPVVIDGRKKPEMYFGAAIIQSSYVGFYLMSVYACPTIKKQIPTELLATLKGKSCFHIRMLDADLKRQIAQALSLSFDFYKRQGWV